MNTILLAARLELKEIFRTMKWIPLLFIFVAFTISTFIGIHQHNKFREIIPGFIESEQKAYDAFANYTDYSHIGVNVIVKPSASEIILSSPEKTSEMAGRINSIAALELNSNSEGLSIFTGKSSLKIAFSQLVLYLGSLLTFLLGTGTFKRRDYFRFLSSLTKPWKLYLYVIIARILLIFLVFVAFFLAVVALIILFGISLGGFGVHLLKYCIMTITVLLFFFAAGTSTGFLFSSNIKQGIETKNQYNYSLIVWFLLLFVFPGIINLTNSTGENDPNSKYRLKAEKLSIFDRFEDEMEKKLGKFDESKREDFKRAAEKFYAEDYPNVEKLEIDRLAKVKEYYDKYNFSSMLFPTSAYMLTSSEISSKGYLNYIKFHDYLISLKRQFLRFWLDRVYYHPVNEMVNFVQNGENVFHAESLIPEYFWLGVSMNLLYSIMLFILSGVYFLRWLYFISDEEYSKTTSGSIRLAEDNRVVGFYSRNDILKNYLYVLLSGKSRKTVFKNNITIDIENVDEIGSHNFLYVCKGKHLPGVLTVIEFIKFIASAGKVNRSQISKVLLKFELENAQGKLIKDLSSLQLFQLQMAIVLLIEKPIYLFDDILSGLPEKECFLFISTVNHLKYVIYTTAMKTYQPKKESPDDYKLNNSWYNQGLVSLQLKQENIQEPWKIKKN